MLITGTHSWYSCAAHDEVLSQWSAVKDEPGPLELDLTEVRWIDPFGIVGLVLFLRNLPPEALPVALRLRGFPAQPSETPTSEGALAALTKLGFWEEVAHVLLLPESGLPQRPYWLEDRNVLIDVTRLHSRDAINVLLRKSGEILQNLQFDPVARGNVMEVLSELSSNVLDHAETEYGGLLVTQTYVNAHGARFLVTSLGDAGVGVRRSLGGNALLRDRLESDAQSLAVAVGKGNSRFATSGRGGGLPRVLEIARRYGGVLAFRSGSGALAYAGAADKRQVFDAPFQQGTQLRLALPEKALLK